MKKSKKPKNIDYRVVRLLKALVALGENDILDIYKRLPSEIKLRIALSDRRSYAIKRSSDIPMDVYEELLVFWDEYLSDEEYLVDGLNFMQCMLLIHVTLNLDDLYKKLSRHNASAHFANNSVALFFKKMRAVYESKLHWTLFCLLIPVREKLFELSDTDKFVYYFKWFGYILIRKHNLEVVVHDNKKYTQVVGFGSIMNDPAPVLVSGKQIFYDSHSKRRLAERFPFFDFSMLYSLLGYEVIEYNGNILVPVGCGTRAGYFVCDLVDDVYYTRTFLDVTLLGTPEGDKLHEELRLTKLDRQWIDLSLSRLACCTDDRIKAILDKCGIVLPALSANDDETDHIDRELCNFFSGRLAGSRATKPS